MRARRIGCIGAGMLAAALWATPAAAQVCTEVTTVAVAFGAYDERFPSPANATGQVRLTCDTGVAYQVFLDAGTHSGGSFSPRAMADDGGLYQLQYNLFTDSNRTVVWGDGTGSTETISGVAQGAQDILQVYGRVFALQPVGVGAYSDTVMVTVEY